VGVGGRVAVGVPVGPGVAGVVDWGADVAVKVGGSSRARSDTNRERRRKPPSPRQYRSKATRVTRVSRL